MGGLDLRTAMSLLPTPLAAIHKQATFQPSLRNNPPSQETLAIAIVNLLPTPTVQQSRNATSGRQPDAVFNTGTTLQDLVFDGTLSPGGNTGSLSTVGSVSSVEQHQTPPSSESTGDHDSTLFSWNG
jgi:hypothetical protein